MINFKNLVLSIFLILLTFIFSCDNNISDIADDDSSVFRTKWEIENGGDSITLPLVENGEYDFTVYWGDGKKNKIKTWDNPAVIHTYKNPGTYDVWIKGTIIGWLCSYKCKNLVEISNWGTLAFGKTMSQFGGCYNLDIKAEDVPDLSMTTSLNSAFYNCINLTVNASFNKWDLSNVENMKSMFANSKFNADMSDWDVSSVTDMREMFKDSNFNGNLSNWNTENVENMYDMFRGTPFNRDISGWDVSKVTNMSGMFANSFFNSDISNWDVSQVRFMNEMFRASLFNKDILSWDVSKVENMSWMFMRSDFNQDISKWDISSVMSINDMFRDSSFKQNISDWNVSHISRMPRMFEGVTLPTEYYDEMLIKWSELTVRKNVVFDGGDSKYSAAAEDARNKLINEFDWTIFDGGLEEPTDEE